MSGERGDPRVCAVIVTFDRWPVLSATLRAVLEQSRQPDRVLVVDNGSRDRTAVELESLARSEPRVEALTLAENLGPAGGFAAGLERVASGDFGYAWALDDDAVPAAGCLEAQLATAGTGAELVFPVISDRSGQVTNFPGWSAVLIATAAIHRAGVPECDLFWWIEDTEYLQWRLPRVHGVEVATASAAAVEHGNPDRGSKPPWKHYYEVRNTIFYRYRVQTGRWRRRYGRMVAVVGRSLLRALLVEDRKLRKVRYIALGVAHGLRGRLGKTIDPQQG